MVTALLDACVLYPAPLRDLLIELAGAGLYRGRWTEEIHREWIENLLKNEPHRDRAKLERTRDLMNQAVLDCLVTGYEFLIPSLTLPDAEDRHVLAAAIHGNAEVIVTTNIRDFPEEVLNAYAIVPQHPDNFILYLLETQENTVLAAIKRLRMRLKNPVVTAEKYLETLTKQPLPQTVSRLQGLIAAT